MTRSKKNVLSINQNLDLSKYREKLSSDAIDLLENTKISYPLAEKLADLAKDDQDKLLPHFLSGKKPSKTLSVTNLNYLTIALEESVDAAIERMKDDALILSASNNVIRNMKSLCRVLSEASSKSIKVIDTVLKLKVKALHLELEKELATFSSLQTNNQSKRK
ncbi:MAG: hypothetical protein HQK52_23875 [Oligoflexia bacterium]|nr:hypothetical protein [Oligoflexia bacterium]